MGKMIRWWDELLGRRRRGWGGLYGVRNLCGLVVMLRGWLEKVKREKVCMSKMKKGEVMKCMGGGGYELFSGWE